MSKNFWDLDMQASTTWKCLFGNRTLDKFLTEQPEMQEAEPDLQHYHQWRALGEIQITAWVSFDLYKYCPLKLLRYASTHS
jgi:hypothetical protein